MANIGIMGGTFNPIHNGHLHIAQAAYTQYPLDTVWFLPNHIAAYKSRASMISVEDRLQMIRLAIAAYPYFQLNTMEIARGGKTYTADTLRILHEQTAKNRYFFILGADSLESFPRWYHPQEILQYAEILVASRGAVDEADVMLRIHQVEAQLGITGAFHLLPCTRSAYNPDTTTWIASSRIRDCIRLGYAVEPETGQPLGDMLPAAVLDYINEHALYA